MKFLQQTPIRGEASRVVATDLSDLSAAGNLADEYLRVPPAKHPDFIPRTFEIAREHNVRVIIPTIDPEIGVYASERDRFRERGIDVWVSTPSVAQLGWDKWALYQWLIEQGLPTVETYEITHLPDGSIDGPVIAKPRSGSSSIGVISAERQSALRPEELDDGYIIQARAPGVELTVDFAVGRAGNVLAIVPRRRLEVRGGEVSKAVTVDYPAVIDLVRVLASRLPGAYGALNVQVFYDPQTMGLNIIEINPRFGGGYPLTHLSGANFFDLLLRDANGEDVREAEWDAGTLLLRYDTEVIVHDYDYRGLDV